MYGIEIKHYVCIDNQGIKMKKFIEEILNNQTFLDVLYNFGSFYKDSDYEKHMNYFYNSSDKKVSFISKNTEWLFITDDGDCYGTLDSFVVKVDNEGQFNYICHGFENLAEYLLKDKLNISNAEYYCKQKKITLENVLKDYETLLKQYAINSNLIINEKEFDSFLYNNMT